VRRTLFAAPLLALSAAALELGRAWQATIRLRRDGKPYGAVRPVLTARKGCVTRSARGVPARTRGSFRVSL
jgi:hypothetical protein